MTAQAARDVLGGAVFSGVIVYFIVDAFGVKGWLAWLIIVSAAMNGAVMELARGRARR